jgi:hypothetical protein
MGSARFRFPFIAHVSRRVSLLLYYRAFVRCFRICVLRARKCLPVNVRLPVAIGH